MISTAIELVELLNRLIEGCRVSERNFANAVGSRLPLDLKRLFDAYAKQRRRFGADLRVELAKLGGVLEISESGSPRVTTRIPNNDVLVAEISASENELLNCYEEAERADVNAPLHAMFERQRVAIEAARNRIYDSQHHPRKSA